MVQDLGAAMPFIVLFVALVVPSCPVIRLAPEVRPVTEVGALGSCGICTPALSVRSG